jgi:hypothetical protein
LLDRELAEYVYGLTDNFLVGGFNKKGILKDNAHEMIPKTN